MNKVVALCAFCGIVLGALSSLSVQPALERLEKEVRRQLEEGGKPAAPAPQTSPQKPAAAADTPERLDAAPERAYLGAVLDDREDRGRGVRVLRVNPAGPAEKAGVEKGDLITALSGIRVRQLSDAVDIFDQMRPGTELTLFIRRGETAQMINVTLGRRPAGVPPAAPSPNPPAGVLPTAPAPPRPALPESAPVSPATPKVLPGEAAAPRPSPPEPGEARPLLPPIGDPAARARVEALEREIEALKQEVETLKQQVRELTLLAGALRREVPSPQPK